MTQISRHGRVSNDKSSFLPWEQLPIAPAALRLHVDQGISFLLFVLVSYAQFFILYSLLFPWLQSTIPFFFLIFH